LIDRRPVLTASPIASTPTSTAPYVSTTFATTAAVITKQKNSLSIRLAAFHGL
jgi:hypothetical protein